MRTIQLLTIPLFLVACEAETTPAPVPGIREELHVTDLSFEQAQSKTPTLLRSEIARGGCFVTFSKEGGEQTIFAAMELCPGQSQDPSELIGELVNFEMGKGRISGCQGAGACGDEPELDMILAITPAN
jgi:hypothetical protein